MSILSENQKWLLTVLSGEKSICDNFYLTGGTALAEFYLEHRQSEDLDFFSEAEFDAAAISVLLRQIQKTARVKSFRYEQSFNRNLFFLELENDTIKTEFTYFPFPRIEKKKKIGDLYVDSLIDIAVNKIFTIYQNPRSRDFIDLYFILKKEKEWNIADLVNKAKVKFDHHLDYLQLGAQLMKVSELKDYPKLIIKINDQDWQSFFITEAMEFSSEVLE
ncbi:MAG: nucleotidyl transferase AbiEii/AbiGii toxin family protein [Candidatus Vogelbacteria bacterium]